MPAAPSTPSSRKACLPQLLGMTLAAIFIGAGVTMLLRQGHLQPTPMWIAPLVLIILGVTVWVVFGRMGQRSRSGKALPAGGGSAASPASWLPPAPPSLIPGQVKLKPQATPTGQLVAALIIAAVWNGIVGTMLLFMLRNAVPWPGVLFMGIFVMVGLGLLAYAGYQFLACLNPTFELELDRDVLRPGDRARLRWHIVGHSARLQDARILLVGREIVTYRRGTDTITETHVLEEQPIHHSDPGRSLPSHGQADLVIPPDTMHSFTTSAHRIAWSLQVRATIPRWPDIRADYPILIAPHGVEPIRPTA